MKRLIIMAALLAFATGVFGQNSFEYISDHYRVITDVSDEYANETGAKMEGALNLYNSLFHFDLSTLDVKLKVVIFKSQEGFDNHLQKVLGETRSDFVYIHYSDLTKSELVGFQKEDSSDFDAQILHQGLIQFVKAFIPTTPLWLSEGMAAYLETSAYDSESGTFTLEKNMNWLETLKAIIQGESSETYLPLTDVLSADKTSAKTKINAFYPQAWGLIHFLMNSANIRYNRILWDSISILDPEATLDENSSTVKNAVFGWNALETTEADYKTYILSLKTYNDYVEEGMSYYDDNELEKAKNSFTEAMKLKPTDYFPYYYLGLIEYAEKQYYKADEYYKTALEKGADEALTNYALGVNAYADNKLEDAATYLGEAKKLDAEKYWDKAQELITRIEAESTTTETTLSF